MKLKKDSLLLLFFSKFSIQEITSYDFIKENRLYFLKLKFFIALAQAPMFSDNCGLWRINEILENDINY